MALIAPITTFQGEIDRVRPSDLNTSFTNILNLLNNLDAGTVRWTNVDATTFKRSGTTIKTIQQIVTANSASDFSTSSTTYQTTNLTTNITPTSASSTVLILAFGSLRSPANGVGAQASLFNGSTDLLSGNGGPQWFHTTAGLSIVPWSVVWPDSPASTSQQTYSVKLKNTNTAGTVLFNNEQSMVLLELL